MVFSTFKQRLAQRCSFINCIVQSLCFCSVQLAQKRTAMDEITEAVLFLPFYFLELFVLVYPLSHDDEHYNSCYE